MAEHSTIEWTRGADGSPGATWNPLTGCSVVSPGCTNCYAMRLAGTRLQHHPSRTGLTKDSKAGPVWTGDVRFNEQWLDQPLRWKRRRRIFVCAHGDLFHPAVPFGWVMRVFDTMVSAPQHTYQILTKRPDRMRDFFTRWTDTTGEDFEPKMVRGPAATRAAHPSPRGQLFADMLEAMGTPPPGAAYPTFDWMEGMITWPDVFPNIWLGVSVEDQRRADERIPDLLATPDAVRWVSAEPLLGPVDLGWAMGHPIGIAAGILARGQFSPGLETLRPLDWVVAGGESGPGARPMHPDWARSLRDQCAAAGVPFFWKQWGEWAPHQPRAGGDLGGDVRAGRVQIVHPTGQSDVEVSEATGGRSTLPGSRYMARVGKKAAGRLLDGIEHNYTAMARGEQTPMSSRSPLRSERKNIDV